MIAQSLYQAYANLLSAITNNLQYPATLEDFKLQTNVISFSTSILTLWVAQHRQHPDPAVRMWCYHCLFEYHEMKKKQMMEDGTMWN